MTTSVITTEHRFVPGKMFGGWGPHLGHLLRRGVGDELWFADDACTQAAGPDVCDADVDRRIDVYRGNAGGWTKMGALPLSGVQQNTGSILSGDTIYTYGVDIVQSKLVECSFALASGATACQTLPFSLGANANYVGAALSPQGHKVVWLTNVMDGGGGQFQYFVSYGGGWNGPRAGQQLRGARGARVCSPPTMLRLYTFTISHFSEKARWAFDLNALAYDERRLLPGPHVPVIRLRAPRTSVPMLQHDQTVVQGSSAILDYAERNLGATRLAARPDAAKRSAELEALADRAFGLGTQRIFYAVLLEHRSAVVDMWTQGGPAWGRAFYALAFRYADRAARRMYKIRPGAIEEAKDLFRRAFDETDRALAGGPYLLGEELSRADVTVASLLAPLCRPSEHILRWPTTLPPGLAGFVSEFEGRPTWDFVLRMYRDHRRAVG